MLVPNGIPMPLLASLALAGASDTGTHAVSGTHLSTNTLPKMAPITTPTTEIVEPYHATEDRIIQAIGALHEMGGNPNIATALEFRVTTTRLRARWNGRKAKSDIVQ